MVITTAAVLTALSPAAIAFGTNFATTLGNKMGEQAATAVHTEAKQLAGKVKEKFDGDAEATAALDLYCAKPTKQYAGILEPHLSRFKVAQDPDVASMVEHITSRLGQVSSGPGGVAAGAISQSISGSGSAYVGGVHITNNQAPASTPDVRWSITHHSGDTYAIENTGATDALDVELLAENVARFDPPEYDNPTWPPGEPRIIFCATAWMPGTPQVVIRYRTTPGGDVQERRRPLPPKP